MMRLFSTTAAVMVALSTAACAPEKPEIVARNPSGEQKQVAVVVGDESFTLEEVTQRLDVMPDWARARFATVDRKKSFLATTVQFELLHDEAKKLDYHRHPDTTHLLERRLVEAWLDEQIEVEPISPEDLRAHYEANPDKFRRGLARKAYVLQSDERERIDELRRRILAADGDQADRFRDLARKFSLHFASAGYRGLIGAVTKEGDVSRAEDTPAVWSADDDDSNVASHIWKLEEREVSEPIEMGDDWLIVMWEGVLPPEEVEFDQVASKVREDLLQQRRRELIESFQK